MARRLRPAIVRLDAVRSEAQEQRIAKQLLLLEPFLDAVKAGELEAFCLVGVGGVAYFENTIAVPEGERWAVIRRLFELRGALALLGSDIDHMLSDDLTDAEEGEPPTG